MALTPEQKSIWRYWIASQDADLKLLAQEMAEEETLPFPLYHGSNTFALSLTKEQRAAIRKACMVLAPYYFAVCKKAGLTRVNDAELREICGSAETADRVADALVTVERYCSGSENFEYEATYLTSTVSKVMGYANRSWFCGELHDALHWLQVAAEQAKAPLPAMSPEELAALQLLQECEASAKPEGVVLRLDNIAMKDLIGYEDGQPINWPRTLHYFLMGTLQENYRACEGYPLTSGVSVPLTDESIQELRDEEEQRPKMLCDAYQKRMFRESMLEKGFSLEDIQAIIER